MLLILTDSPLMSTKIGTVVSGLVTKIQGDQILVTTKEGVSAIVVNDAALEGKYFIIPEPDWLQRMKGNGPHYQTLCSL